MLNAIIIDDDRDAIDCLALELDLYCPNQVNIVAKCRYPLEGLSAIRQHHADLVFVDIDMGTSMNGIDFIHAARAEGFDQLAFVIMTGHEEYAIEAFKQAVTHYLLKPWQKQDLLEAIRRAQEKKKNTKPTTQPLFAMATKHEGTIYLSHHEIAFFEAEGNYSNIHGVHSPKNSKNAIGCKFVKLISKQLKAIEMMVDNSTFFRVHHSYLVNLLFVEKYYDGKVFLKHYAESPIPVAKDRRTDFLQTIEAMRI
jgi:two-component system, LytTR family, response regulator